MDISNLEDIKQKESWVKIAQKVLSICWKSKGGYYFHEPVDPSRYGINDYFEIIEQPMDFGMVKRKLDLQCLPQRAGVCHRHEVGVRQLHPL